LIGGDAVASFTPVYGQGVTVACIEADNLNNILRDKVGPISKEYIKRNQFIVDFSWKSAIVADMRYKQTPGKRFFGQSFLGNYVINAVILGNTDKFIREKVRAALHLLIPSSVLFHPRILFPVLLYSLGLKKATLVKDPPKVEKP